MPHGRSEIGFGLPGPFWRAKSGASLTWAVWTRILKAAAERAGVPVATSHAFRRVFATAAAARVGRSLASLAGNWSSPRRMDDHYVQLSHTRLREQLTNLAVAPTADPTHLPVLVSV